MKFLTLTSLNKNLRSFFDTIVLPSIKKQRIIVWDKLSGRATLTNGSVQNAGTLVGKRYSYISEPLTLESKGKVIKIYGPDGAEEWTGVVSIEFEGTGKDSLAVWADFDDKQYCYKIEGTY